MASKTATASNFTITSSWTGNGTPSTGSKTITFDISSVLKVYTINSVTLYCDLAAGKWSGKFTVGGQSVSVAAAGMSFNVKSLLGTSGDHYTLSVTFTYKCNKTNYTNDGASHSSGGAVKNISVVVDYTPYTNCTAPTSVSAANTNVAPGATVRVSWSGAKAGTNNAIASYTLYRSSDNSTWTSLKTGITNTYYDVAAPTGNGDSYYYKVATIGSVSGYDSAKSDATASIKCSYTDPSVSAVKIDSGTNDLYKLAGSAATLSWTGTNGTNNAVSKYEIYQGSTKLGETTSKSYSVTTPTAGQSAIFSVKAIGAHSDSGKVESPTLFGYSVPTAPTTVQVDQTNIGPGAQTTLRWSGAKNGSYNSIKGYRIYRATSANGTYSQLGDDISSTAASGSVAVSPPTGNGSSYFYKVMPLASRENGAQSTAYAQLTTLWTAPSVSGLKLDGNTSDQYRKAEVDATLSWTGTNGTNNAITGYKVYEDGEELQEVAGLSCSVTAHATAGQSHVYTIKPLGTLEDGAVSDGITLYTFSDPAAPAPAFANPTPDAGTNTTLSWPASAAGEFNPVAGYRIFACDTASGAYEQVGSDLSVSMTSFTVTAPATMGISRYYKVMALGQRSDSGMSDAIQIMAQVYTLPIAPTVTVDSATPDAGAQTTLRWADAVSGTNNPITGYRIVRSNSENGTYTQLGDDLPADAASLAITAPLTMGAHFYYRVYTLGTKAGFTPSQPSQTVAIMAQIYTKCTAPMLSIARTISNPGEFVLVSWSESQGGTNNPVTGYQVYRSLNGAAFAVYTQVDAETFSINEEIPASGNTYAYKVVALGTKAGFDSNESGTVSVKSNTPPEQIASFVEPHHIYESGILRVSWAAPPDVDANIAGYDVERRQEASSGAWGAWQSFNTVSGLFFEDEPTSIGRGLKFQYRVRAVDALGLTGEYLNTKEYTRNSTPLQPIIVHPTAGAETFDVQPILFLGVEDDPDGQAQSVYIAVNSGAYALAANVPDGVDYLAVRCPTILAAGNSYTLHVRLTDSLGAPGPASSILVSIVPATWDRMISTGSIISAPGTSFIGDTLLLISGEFDGETLISEDDSFNGETLNIQSAGGVSHQSEIIQMYNRINACRAYYGLENIEIPSAVGTDYGNAGDGKIGMFAAWGAQMLAMQHALTDVYELLLVAPPSWVAVTAGMHPRADAINQIRSAITNL